MKIQYYKQIINAAFNYVIQCSHKYNFDESHALKHSMDVYHTANQIFNNEIISTPELKDNKLVIDISSILHDMCDSKYVDETTSVNNMVTYMCTPWLIGNKERFYSDIFIRYKTFHILHGIFLSKCEIQK